MQTPATPVATTQVHAVSRQTHADWSDYFPVINKIIIVAILLLAVVIVSGIDVARLPIQLMNRDTVSTVVSGVSLTTASVGGFKGFSVTGPGGWKVIVGLIVVLGSITAVVFAVLSSSGLDAAYLKEREEKAKEAKKRKETTSSAAGGTEPTECNLATYKLFYAPKEETAEAPEAAATPSAT